MDAIITRTVGSATPVSTPGLSPERSPEREFDCLLACNVTRICYVGAGYVGALSAIVMAHFNPEVEVTAIDINADLIRAWNSDSLPIYEPGLEELMFLNNTSQKDESNDMWAQNECFTAVPKQRARRLPNLKFSTDIRQEISESEIVFLCVNTPLDSNSKSLNMAGLNAAIESIAAASHDSKIVVEKSTVPCGMAEDIQAKLNLQARDGVTFHVLSNPEFLAQGSALENLLNPSRVVIGWPPNCHDLGAVQTLIDLYRSNVPLERIKTMTSWSSELAKLAANAFVAQRISSINSLSAICEATAANIDDVASVVGSDARIGSGCLKAGLGYGGSCLEKDVSCLAFMAHSLGLPQVADYWRQVNEVNDYQNRRIPERVMRHLKAVTRKRIAILGFAFKNSTTDTRNSTARSITQDLVRQGATVTIFDPLVSHMQVSNAISEFSGREVLDHVILTNSAYDACQDAHAIFLHTDWKLFTDPKALDWGDIAASMQAPKLFLYGRGQVDDQALSRHGFEVLKVGERSLLEKEATMGI